MTYILDGIKVIELASYGAAPAVATILSDFGADVIKIEAPTGDDRHLSDGNGETEYYRLLNSRNKKGICLDLSKAAGKDVLHQLVRSSDVLLTNFLDREMEQFELEYETLRKTNPKLIYAHVSGYGRKGPDRDQRGFDMVGWWARTGILAAMRFLRGETAPPATGVGDHVTALALSSAVMMALYHREKTGEGNFVSTSLVASGCYANGVALQRAIAGYDCDAALGKATRIGSSLSNLYRTRDDESVVLIITNLKKEWSSLVKALGHKEWLKDPEFVDITDWHAYTPDLESRISSAIREYNLKDLCWRLNEYGLAYSAVERAGDVVCDAHLIENGVLVRTNSELPDYRWTVSNPIDIEGFEKRQPAEGPAIGEHSEQILKDFGFSDNNIRDLIVAGVIVQSR
ncbi:MAG: CaiB/BaiF CoA transferase family protein [Candidatus Azotimanducaceae bacterium]|uniref:CoA transferase n=1 Tax=OM182 bacterium TaxID=2510334 RepID=A0A520S2G8_9GAMM|nr:hypothetical protein [Gammaproteobacteria bacterium]RZO76646.1 MAG: CoA transferase [OM182 bacterium]